MTPSRRFNLGPDRSGKTVERYRALYEERWEGAEFSFEAKSPRAAYRIAASYEAYRRGAFQYRACTLICLLKYENGCWHGMDRSLIDRYSPFMRQCAGCLQRKPKAWMVDAGNGDFICRTCERGMAEIMPPSIPIFAEELENVA